MGLSANTEVIKWLENVGSNKFWFSIIKASTNIVSIWIESCFQTFFYHPKMYGEFEWSNFGIYQSSLCEVYKKENKKKKKLNND